MKTDDNATPLFNALPPAAVKEQLRTLWHDAFGDGYEFIDAFFATYPCEEVAHTLSLGGQVVSVLYALPFTLYNGGDNVPVAYIYAVSTRPEFRGRGYMSLLMRQVELLLRDRGVRVLFLLPATDALRGFYARLGFADCSHREIMEYSLCGSAGGDYDLSQASSADDIYSSWVGWQHAEWPVVLHSHELIALNIASCRAQGGGCYMALRGGLPVAAAFAIREGESVLLLAVEGCDSAACEWLRRALCGEFGVDSLSYMTAGGAPSFMWHWLCDAPAPQLPAIDISLMLDK